jgi:predicted Zn finger-like uncharacterized protein
MPEAIWLLRCPHCDERFEFASEKLTPTKNIVKCPECHQDFKVKITVSVETSKIGRVR